MPNSPTGHDMSPSISGPSRTRDSVAWIVAILPVPLTIIAWNALPTQQGFVALAAIVVAGAWAFWRRPPTRDPAGRRIRASRIVNTATAVGIAGIPIGYVAVFAIAGGRHGAPLILGIGMAVFGAIAFAVYSLVWMATRRANLAAVVALTIGAVIALWFAVPAFLDQLAGRNPF